MIQFHFYYVYQIKKKHHSFVYTLKICLVSLFYLMKAPYNWFYQFLTMQPPNENFFLIMNEEKKNN